MHSKLSKKCTPPLLNEWNLADKLFLCSYDKKTYKYTLVESIELVDEVTELDRYVFVVRGRVGQSTTSMEAILSQLSNR